MSADPYITCPPGQDPRAFTAYVLGLVPGERVARDTSTRVYALRVSPRVFAAWEERLPQPPAVAPAEPAPTPVVDEVPVLPVDDTTDESEVTTVTPRPARKSTRAPRARRSRGTT